MEHHPKLTWEAWRRDVLRAFATLAGIILVPSTLFVLLYSVIRIRPDDVKRETTALELVSIQRALELFHDKHRRFPSTEEGLRALVKGQYLERVPFDPWGNAYGYELRDGRPALWSYGADGAPGGEGKDADISSREDP